MTPFGEYLPDVRGGIETVVGGKNVYLDSSNMYQPVPSLTPTGATVAAKVVGSVFGADISGNVRAFAGTLTKLYRLGSNNTWSDVSKVATTYGTSADESWRFAQFGNRMIATNYADAIQSIDLSSGTNFADLSAGAPKARHIATVDRFLMTANTTDTTYSTKPTRVWWSAINDATNWPTPATSAAAAVQSGFQDLFGTGGAIQGIAPKVGSLDAIILQERTLTRCQYIGLPDVFSFQPLEGARGCPSPNSITVIGGVLYYLGEDGFYACDGSSSVPIGAGKVDETFWLDVNQSFLNAVQAVYNQSIQCWLVAYPSVNSPSGVIDKILSFNIMTRRWAPAWQVSIEHLTTLGSIGYTLEDLDAFGTTDTIVTSFDSREFAGNARPAVAAFTTSHNLSYFTGPFLESEIETGDEFIGNERLMTIGIRPHVCGPSMGTANVRFKVGYRDSLKDAIQYTDLTALNRAGVAPIRRNGRYMRAVINISSGSTWCHTKGFEFDRIQAGRL